MRNLDEKGTMQIGISDKLYPIIFNYYAYSPSIGEWTTTLTHQDEFRKIILVTAGETKREAIRLLKITFKKWSNIEYKRSIRDPIIRSFQCWFTDKGVCKLFGWNMDQLKYQLDRFESEYNSGFHPIRSKAGLFSRGNVLRFHKFVTRVDPVNYIPDPIDYVYEDRSGMGCTVDGPYTCLISIPDDDTHEADRMFDGEFIVGMWPRHIIGNKDHVLDRDHKKSSIQSKISVARRRELV